MIKYIIFFQMISLSAFAEVDCAVSLNQYFPQTVVEISESTNKGKQNYTYILSNTPEGTGAFRGINIFTNEPLKEIKNPNAQWSFRKKITHHIGVADGNSSKPYIGAGESIVAFSYEGSQHFGIVPVNFLKSVSFRKKLGRYKLKAAEDTPCPGLYTLGSTAENNPHPRSISLAPIPKDQKSAISLIKHDGAWTGSVYQNEKLVEISPLDKGTKEILILGSKDFNINDIDIKSLKIGRGEAKVKKSQIIKANAVNNIDVLSKAKAESNNLAITFDLQDANILCEIDHAILIEGQTKKGNKFFSGVRMKPVLCDLNTFSKEIPKMKAAEKAYKAAQ